MGFGADQGELKQVRPLRQAMMDSGPSQQFHRLHEQRAGSRERTTWKSKTIKNQWWTWCSVESFVKPWWFGKILQNLWHHDGPESLSPGSL